MRIQNIDNIKKQRRIFYLSFFVLMVLIFSSGAFMLVTADRGIALLEQKKIFYDKVIQKQAEFNFALDGIFRDLYNLKTKPRTSNEYKYMQKIITDQRMKIEEEISSMPNEVQSNYVVYSQILEVINEVQATMDALDVENRKREYNMDKLEKCRKKYQEITRNNNEKNK